jgi:hypothetical protein
MWRRVLHALSTLAPRHILLFGFALFLVYAFPGYMSTDSAIQLAEARSGRFSDAHPPLMAFEWRFLDWVVSGPLLMLLVQGALFLGGLYVLLRRELTPTAAAWVAIGIFLFPPVMTTMAVIWKDSQMAACLVAGTAGLLHARLRVRLLAGLGLMVAATSLRHNALAAAVPLVFFLFEWRPGMRWWRRIAIMIAGAAVTVGVAFGISRVLTVEHVRLTPVFSDIVGVIAVTHDRTDEDLAHVLRDTPLVSTKDIQAHARNLYRQRGSWRIMSGDDAFFAYPRTPAQWAALNRAWKELVLGDPGAYFECHWDGYQLLLGLSEYRPRAPVYNLFIEVDAAMDETDHNASHSVAQGKIGRVLYYLADDTPMFRPWIYGVIALVLLAVACRDRLTAGLMLSGLLYELSFFPVGAEPDYRYSHWMIASVVIATMILLARWWQYRRTA